MYLGDCHKVGQAIVYTHIYAAYLLWFVPVFIVLFYFRYKKDKEKLKLFAQKKVLHRSTEIPSLFWFISKKSLFIASWIFITFALMGPKGNPRYAEGVLGEEEINYSLRRKAHDITFLLDISQSMQVKDARLEKSRLEYAKEIIEDLISRLKGEAIGLYTFTSSVDKRIPHTMDYVYFRLQLRDITANQDQVPGSDFEAALNSVLSEITKHVSGKLKTLIILSDGEDTSGNMEGAKKLASEIVKKADDANLRVYAVGLGSKEGGIVPDVQQSGGPVKSMLDEFLLKELAEARGDYFNANQYTPLSLSERIYTEMGQDDLYVSDAELTQVTEAKEMIYDHYYQIPLAAGILLGLLSFYLPGTNQLIKEDNY